MATQGGPGIAVSVDSLLDALTFEKKHRPRLVHRLDRDTSGVLVIARSPSAAAALAESFRARDTLKVYWALTSGAPKAQQGTVKAALAKVTVGPNRDEKMIALEDVRDHEDAKRAVTDYATLERVKTNAWLALKPVTGRTHQIRVHCAALGTPIVGDFKYGGTAARPQGAIADRLHLHARYLKIAHPKGGQLEITAPLPQHMRSTWELFGWNPDDPRNPFAEQRRR